MNIISAILFFIIGLMPIVVAQQPCVTEMPQEMIDWLTEYKSNPYYLLKVSRSDNLYYIPVKIHIVGDNNGNGYYKMRQLLSTMCELNAQYAPVGFYFYIYGDIHYLNNSTMYDHATYSDISTIVNANNDNAAVNIYFVENAAGACGYFSGGWGTLKPYIAVNKSCAGIGNTTVAHEIGHYFALPHTFFGWENRSPNDAPTASDERADGSNCATSGDRFCDTPADYISNRWSCPYNSNKLDYVGTPYNPDGTLYMSYSNDACQNKFSNEQIDAMINFLNSNSRRFLLNQPIPDTSIGNTVTILYPPNEATGIPANYAQLKWDRVPGATHYHVLGTRFSNPNVSSFDIITTDTFLIINNLTPGFRYRWRVKPFKNANLCAPYSSEFAFTATAPTPIEPNIQINPISCYGKNDGRIALYPIGGAEPYNFNWSTGETGVSEINNLAEGTYYVTITDANNASLVLNIDIIEPNPIDIQFAENGGIVNAVVSGGTPPYSYNWNNGVTGTSISINPGQYYYLQIVDSRGCRLRKDSNGFVNVEEQQLISGIKIYPNPVMRNTEVNIEFALSKNESVHIVIYDFAARKIVDISDNALAGVYKKTIFVDNLPKGMYYLKMVAGHESITRKLLVQ
jgi:hypothetical protein